MKSRVRVFDEFVALRIGGLPKFLLPYSVWIGRFTTPLLWMTMFVLAHVFVITPGMLTRAAAVYVLLLPIATILKLFIRRSRPETIYTASMKIKSYSFPSSHAYTSALMAGYATLMAMLSSKVEWLLVSVVLVTLTIMVGASRVHVGAHYPSDVLGGWVLAACLCAVTAGLGVF